MIWIAVLVLAGIGWIPLVVVIWKGVVNGGKALRQEERNGTGQGTARRGPQEQEHWSVQDGAGTGTGSRRRKR